MFRLPWLDMVWDRPESSMQSGDIKRGVSSRLVAYNPVTAKSLVAPPGLRRIPLAPCADPRAGCASEATWLRGHNGMLSALMGFWQ